MQAKSNHRTPSVRDLFGRDPLPQLRVVAMLEHLSVDQLKRKIRREYTEQLGALPSWLINEAYGEYCTVRLNKFLSA